jgi:hypothetical protein
MHEDTWAGFRRLGNGLEAGWKREILGVVERTAFSDADGPRLVVNSQDHEGPKFCEGTWG